MKPRYDVCAAVVSDLPFDARVWKEVRSLAASGRSVRLIGCRYDIPSRTYREEGGVDVVEFPLGTRARGKSRLRRAAAAAGLFAEIVRTRADVYHAHNVHTVFAAWLASRLRRARLVYDGHELYGVVESAGLKGRLIQRASLLAERFAVRSADVAITTNASRADVLRQRHGRSDIVVLGNVPSLVQDLEALDPGYPRDVPVLLYQGWIAPETRAFRETVQALRQLPEVHFVILGFGHDARRDTIRGWAAEEGVTDRVHFLPPRPFDELVRTAAAATVGLVPIKPFNVNQELGDTNKLFEYLMAALPVVASDLPEIARVAREGDPPVGEVFDPFSPDSIARAVQRILDDPVRYEARRREARRLALERYNWTVEEQRLIESYDSLSQRDETRTRNPVESRL